MSGLIFRARLAGGELALGFRWPVIEAQVLPMLRSSGRSTRRVSARFGASCSRTFDRAADHVLARTVAVAADPNAPPLACSPYTVARVGLCCPDGTSSSIVPVGGDWRRELFVVAGCSQMQRCLMQAHLSVALGTYRRLRACRLALPHELEIELNVPLASC